jgi:heme/copper-type cytochrome/quinol oxidase subunit 3
MLGGFGGMALVAALAAHRHRRSLHAAGALATYWHFLAGLWIYLFAVLFWI